MLVPLKPLMDTPEEYGFKRCKKPYNNCWYLCFSRGVKMVFLSKYMVDIVDWMADDPRVHSRANCKYRDYRTAQDYVCELIQMQLVDTHYGKLHCYEAIEEAERIIREGSK